jgi:tetratricopeptide (TPR) repeat protein
MLSHKQKPQSRGRQSQSIATRSIKHSAGLMLVLFSVGLLSGCGSTQSARSTSLRSDGRYPSFESSAATLAQAVEAKNENDLSQARGLLAIVLKAEPENTTALDLLAEVATLQNDWRLLRATLRRRARVNPDSAVVQNRIGKEMIHSVRLERGARIQTQAGIQQASAEVSRKQTTASVHNEPQNVIEDGISFLQRAVEVDPRNTNLVHDLVGALAEQGRDLEAVSAIRRSLDINPTDSSLPIMAARMLEASDDWTSAIFYYDVALQNDPKNRMWHRHRGMCLYHLGNFDRASVDFEVALPGSPVSPQLTEHVAWAKSYMQQGKLERAGELLHRIVNDDGVRNSEIESLRVLCQSQMGHQIEALKILAQALRDWPNDVQLLEAEQFVHAQYKSPGELASVE